MEPLQELEDALQAGGAGAAPAEAPDLDLSTLFGNAPYEGREERQAPAYEEPPAPVAAPRADPQTDARIEALERRNAELMEQSDRRRQEEAVAQAQWQESQQRGNYYQESTRRAQAAAQVPDVNPDEILADPAKFRAYGQGLVNAAITSTLAAIQPAVAEHRENAARTQALLTQQQNAAMQAAVGEVRRITGFDLSPAEQNAMALRLRSMGADGEMLLTNPAQIVNAVVLDRVQRGQPLVARNPAAPPGSPTHGSRKPRATGNVPINSLPPAARQVFGTLGIRGGDITQAEISELGLRSLLGR